MNWLTEVGKRIFYFDNAPETNKPVMRRVTSGPARISPGPSRQRSTAPFGIEIKSMGDFYSYLRRKIPVISNAINAWNQLSSHGNEVRLVGGSERQQKRAQEAIEALDDRVFEHDFCGRVGFDLLLSLFYTTLYSFGRACFELVPYRDLSGVAYVAYVDPFSIVFKRVGQRMQLFQRQADRFGDEKLVPLPSARMMYAAFDADGENPQGISLLDSIEWVIEIKEKLIEDMARASHNAGFPRLHVQVQQGEALPGEAPNDFIGRMNADFDETVDAFRDLDVDDNVFTWGHVEVGVLQQETGREFGWSINLDRINDEVAAGLRLPHWVLGISSSVTKNWVGAQQDLLMQRVGRGSSQGSAFVDWVRNTDLRMRGLPVRTQQHFKPIDNPGVLIQRRADRFEFETIDNKVQRGYITKDEGARMMGLERAARQDGEDVADNESMLWKGGRV